MVLLAAYNVLLYRYSGKEDILVGTAVANRTVHETQDIMGLFMNMLVLRSKLNGEIKFLDLLQQVKDTALKGYAHQELPFERYI
jgi:non-ribosomal peptide synthetase component F